VTMDVVAAPEIAPAEPGWHRVRFRTMLVRPFNEILGFVPVLVGVIALGRHGGNNLWYGLGVIVLLLGRGLLHWLTTRYRITDDQFEIRSGLVWRRRQATNRDRIRTVESTAKFGHRLFGVTAVRIGTGQHQHKGHRPMTLDAVTAAEAERLRRVLLQRVAPAAPEAVDPHGELIAELDRRWLRYAPLTLSGLFAMSALLGLVWRSLNELYIRVSRIGLLRAGERFAQSAGTGEIIAIIGVIAVVIIGFGSMVVYLFRYAGYRLAREPDATLHVRRGLLTTSAVTIEEARLRGVEVHEPLLLRAGRGARLTAVATGLAARSEIHLLMPPGPVAEAHRVAARVLDTTGSPTRVGLVPHSARALRRRLVRAVVPAGLVVLALWLAAVFAGWPAWLWQVAVALPVLAVPLGFSRYRNLGHALTPRYLVSRTGSLDRRTAALRRDGIIGWRVRRSFFQRRVGLVTLTATTSAGRGAYDVLDIAEADGLALAENAVPGMLAPFLVEDAR
jgi:putative membrane protein